MIAFYPLQLESPPLSRQVPWANWLLVMVNIVLFMMFTFFGGQWVCGRGTNPVAIVLYGFSHAGFWHLPFNMWTLLVFGDAVNRRIGNTYYLLAYLGTQVALGLFAWFVIPAGVIGASGAIFAVIGIALLLLPSARLLVGCLAIFPFTILLALIRRPGQPWQWAIRWTDFRVSMLWCLLLVPFLEVWGLIWSGWNWTNLGHLLGLVAGVVCVLLLPQRISMRRPAPAL
jgi:membrane associated rhomboid family serine protease